MKFIKAPTSALAWALVVAGFLAIGAGWGGVQSTPVVAVQLAYLASGGFVGLALVLVGVGIADKDELRKTRVIMEELRDRFDDLEHDVSDLATNLEPVRRRPGPRTRAAS